MALYQYRLSAKICKGSKGGPGFSVDIVEVASGLKYRNLNRGSFFQAGRRGYDISYGIKSISDYNLIKDVFIVMQGPVHEFRFKDFTDFEADDQPAGVYDDSTNSVLPADGSTTQFPMYKSYSIGSGDDDTRYRRIVCPALDGTYVVKVDGVEVSSSTYSVSHLYGWIEFDSAPSDGSVITWSGTFDVPVMFVTDKLEPVLENGKIVQIPSILLMETKPNLPELG